MQASFLSAPWSKACIACTAARQRRRELQRLCPKPELPDCQPGAAAGGASAAAQPGAAAGGALAAAQPGAAAGGLSAAAITRPGAEVSCGSGRATPGWQRRGEERGRQPLKGAVHMALLAELSEVVGAAPRSQETNQQPNVKPTPMQCTHQRTNTQHKYLLQHQPPTPHLTADSRRPPSSRNCTEP